MAEVAMAIGAHRQEPAGKSGGLGPFNEKLAHPPALPVDHDHIHSAASHIKVQRRWGAVASKYRSSSGIQVEKNRSASAGVFRARIRCRCSCGQMRKNTVRPYCSARAGCMLYAPSTMLSALGGSALGAPMLCVPQLYGRYATVLP